MYTLHGVPMDYQPQFDGHRRFFDDASNDLIDGAAAAAVKQGEGWDLQLPMRCADGSQIWVRSVGHVEFEDGQARLAGRHAAGHHGLARTRNRSVCGQRAALGIVDHLPCGVSAFDQSLHMLIDNTESGGCSTCSRSTLTKT